MGLILDHIAITTFVQQIIYHEDHPQGHYKWIDSRNSLFDFQSRRRQPLQSMGEWWERHLVFNYFFLLEHALYLISSWFEDG